MTRLEKIGLSVWILLMICSLVAMLLGVYDLKDVIWCTINQSGAIILVVSLYEQ
ncbi:MAG: hypothetical protein KGI60_00215 [Patescibacteria group bacterium]|nr:hypothetical protein [Patescibacteria group bacterium]